MPRRLLRLFLLTLGLPALQAAAPSPRADVVWQERTVVTGPAAVRGGGTTESHVELSGSRMRTDVKNRVGPVWDDVENMGLIAPSTIASLEAGHLYRLHPQTRSFIDETLEEASQRLKRVRGRRGPAWAFEEPGVEIEGTGGLQTIAGVDCKRVLVTVIGKFTGAGLTAPRAVVLKGDLWVAGSVSGRSEVDSFVRQAREKIGIDALSLQAEALADPRYRAGIEELFKALAKVDGLPLRVTLTLANAPPQSPIKVTPVPGPDPRSAGGSGGAPTTAGTEGGTGVPVPIDLKTKLKTRSDAGDRFAPKPVEMPPEWTFSRSVTEFSTKAADAARFEPPAEFKRLVPKSRRDQQAAPGAAAPQNAGKDTTKPASDLDERKVSP